MGILAIDIETASPSKEPQKQKHFRDTSYFELVAIALGYRDESDIDTNVVFREGGWDDGVTSKALREAVEWYADKNIQTVLTYNGNGFDKIHLENWADIVDNAGLEPGIAAEYEDLFDYHIDLAEEGRKKHRDKLPHGSKKLSLEKLSQWEDVTSPKTRYADYEIDDHLYPAETYGPSVEGWHVGESIGEMYVNLHANGAAHTRTFQEVQRLLQDYATSDIVPLFELYDELLG